MINVMCQYECNEMCIRDSGVASKRGVLVKGSNYLEALNNVSIRCV